VSDPLPKDPPGHDAPAAPAPTVTPPWALKGTDFARIFSLSDGIFAFSMTLLVLSLALPANSMGIVTGAGASSYLHSQKFYVAIYGYVLTFFIIAAWWRTHHMQFSYIRSYDRRLMQLNTLFLIFIAILPFATQVLNTANAPAGPVFFAAIQVAAGLALAGTWTYASGMGHLAPELPKEWERYITLSTFTVPIVFGISIPLAFFVGSQVEYLWIAVFLIPVTLRKRTAR
jgi:uncharacterized membrane protein